MKLKSNFILREGNLVEEIKKIDIKEFRELGFLQEANRLFFHPLGLALEVVQDENGNEQLGGIWDYRDDPEGVTFGEGMVDREKIRVVTDLRVSKVKARRELLGGPIQGI